LVNAGLHCYRRWRVTTPAYSRLDVDERRRQLLDASAQIFTERRYDDVSMSEIAAAAGISKGLLYHYFTNKQELFRATLEDTARDIATLIAPDPSLPPAERVSRSLGDYLAWIEANEASYVRLIEDMGSVSDVLEIVTRVREDTAVLIATQAVGGDPPRALVTAALGWLWAVDGVCLDWLARRHMTREQVRDFLVRTLFAMVMAAASVEPAIELKLD
jgi:AcrR family transcriptional regulator